MLASGTRGREASVDEDALMAPDTVDDPPTAAGILAAVPAIECRRARARKPARSSRILRDVLNLEEFEHAARRRMLRAVHGYVAGGSQGGDGVAHNRHAFASYRLLPRILRDVETRSQDTMMFGRRWSAPFVIAPMGAAAVVTYDADNRMARVARRANIPCVLSGNSITPLEEVARTNPQSWFAAYQRPDAENIRAMCERVAAAGYDVFMLTVDNPVPSNRENNVRTGYTMPLRIGRRLAFDALTHPRWLGLSFARTLLRRGAPVIGNADPHDRPTIFSRKLGTVTGHASFSWAQAELVRRHWPGHFVLKGVLSPEDARIARESGVDGIVVSNHGGRQLEGAVSPIDVLPDIKAQSGEMTILADSGFRRGSDVLKALALGAHGVMIGRPFLFAAALAGEAGVHHAIALLRREIDIDMALLGAAKIGDVDAACLRRMT